MARAKVGAEGGACSSTFADPSATGVDIVNSQRKLLARVACLHSDLLCERAYIPYRHKTEATTTEVDTGWRSTCKVGKPGKNWSVAALLVLCVCFDCFFVLCGVLCKPEATKYFSIRSKSVKDTTLLHRWHKLRN